MIKRLLPSPLVTAPKVSVVIPCYNYGRYLPAAVASALDQPGVDIEVIIADNGSTDDSLAIARKLSEADTRIAVTTQPFNQEYLVNYNDGIKKTTGKYIVVLDADDLLTPGSITRSAALMEARPNVVFAYGYTPRFTEVPPKPHLSVRSWSVWRGLDWIDWLYRTGRNVIISPEVLIRASVLHELGGFDTDYPVGADLLLWLQCARQGDVARVNGPDQAFFRIHGKNMQLVANEGILTDLRGRRTIFERYLEFDPPTRRAASKMLTSSKRAIAFFAARCANAEFDSAQPKARQAGSAYAQFALETWPPIEQSLRWRPVAARQRDDLPSWWRLVGRVGRSARQFGVQKLHRQLGR